MNKFEPKKSNDYISYLVIVIVVILVRIFLISPARVSGSSMYDTLSDKEFVFVNKLNAWTGNINRFDIVVVKLEGDYLIKRLIGLPGETVEYKDDILYINGKEIEHDYDFQSTSDFIYNVPDGEYFVLGDNRSISRDSRWFGSVEKKKINGTVSIVFFPFSKIRKVY